MAKRKAKKSDAPQLFEVHQRQHSIRTRRQRAIFIPRFLREASQSQQLAGAARDSARAIILRWADLDRDGHLIGQTETSMDARFLDEVFGQALGYAVKTHSPAAFQLEHKLAVPGVGTADGALGDFPSARTPTAVIEMKDASTDLDRDKASGRTPAQQCWDYLNGLPDCPWGIVSNFSTIRLYHRGRGTQAYEEFSLQELRDPDRFNDFYCLFERGGLLKSALGQQPRALQLLERTLRRQRDVGDELYESYRYQRLRLIEFLMQERGKLLDPAVRIAQKLLDRVIFIAFCEDRNLLPHDCLERARTQFPAFSKARNPGWHNFLGLFHQIDKGAKALGIEQGYNGGLFADDPELDAIDLPDAPWIVGLTGFGKYDFAEEVSVEVLGQLFERSITELEKLRVGGLFAMKAAVIANGNGEPGPGNGKDRKRSVATEDTTREEMPHEDKPGLSRMPKSAQRKRFGVYYTPPAFTGLLVDRTVDALITERFDKLRIKHDVDPDAEEGSKPDRLLAYWREALEMLKSVTVCDPACGSGAFLIRAYDALEPRYRSVVHGLAAAMAPETESVEDAVPDLILRHNLFGVDLSEEAVEITQLSLWIRSARRGRTLADLSRNIICGNSLVADKAVHERALDWGVSFPEVFPKSGNGGFSCVIGNPPWERVKVQDREFFSLLDPDTAQAVSAAERRRRIERMPVEKPELHKSYTRELGKAQRMLDYARQSGQYPLTGKGDINTYMLFAELAMRVVAPDGLVGLLVPSGIATDDTTKEYFTELMETRRLVLLYDFENKRGHFPDVHRAFKFSGFVFGGAERKNDRADFVFFAHDLDDVAPHQKARHIPLTVTDMALLNPNTRTCPIFRTRRDADLTRAVYRRVPILIDRNRHTGGNPWGIHFFTMFHQTNDAEHFQTQDKCQKAGYKLRGNVFVRGRSRALPLYEAKMVQAFDHRAASVVVEADNWMRQGQKAETATVEHQNPEFVVQPRWWVEEATVDQALAGDQRPAYLAYKDVTSPTNERTMIAAFLPKAGVVNSAPLVLTDSAIATRRVCCLLANLNAVPLDYIARQKVGGVHLNFFIVEQLPVLAPDDYAQKCPWSKRERLEHWISERVLKLTCTADDMKPLAQACEFEGSEGGGVHKWRDAERIELKAQLDAAYAHLYGVSEDDFAYMLSTFSGLSAGHLDAAIEAYRKLQPV